MLQPHPFLLQPHPVFATTGDFFATCVADDGRRCFNLTWKKASTHLGEVTTAGGKSFNRHSGKSFNPHEKASRMENCFNRRRKSFNQRLKKLQPGTSLWAHERRQRRAATERERTGVLRRQGRGRGCFLFSPEHTHEVAGAGTHRAAWI